MRQVALPEERRACDVEPEPCEVVDISSRWPVCGGCEERRPEWELDKRGWCEFCRAVAPAWELAEDSAPDDHRRREDEAYDEWCSEQLG